MKRYIYLLFVQLLLIIYALTDSSLIPKIARKLVKHI